MGQLAKKDNLELSIVKVKVTDQQITAEISDGRVVSVPISWFPRLCKATPKQIQNFEISPSGYGIHWADIDEDISVKSFIS